MKKLFLATILISISFVIAASAGSLAGKKSILGDMTKVTKHAREVEYREICLTKFVPERENRIKVRALVMATKEKSLFSRDMRKAEAKKQIGTIVLPDTAEKLWNCLGLSAAAKIAESKIPSVFRKGR